MPATVTIPKRPLTWFITGCSSGFGLLLARVVQANGHRLIASSRNPQRTPDLVAEVEGKGGRWVQLDVNDPQNAKVIDDLEAAGEHIDVLVNNAGNGINGAIEQYTEEEVRPLMETHYFGPYRLIRAAVPNMRRRRFGIIINFSSGAALSGVHSMGPYGAGKAALDCVSKVLAKEVEDFNIRVLVVTPGGFNTNMANVVAFCKNPLPEDYAGSAVDGFLKVLNAHSYVPPGDPDKAVKAIYEVAMGEGVGAGLEAERFLPLGNDVAAMIEESQAYFSHAVEVLGHVTNGVSRDN